MILTSRKNKIKQRITTGQSGQAVWRPAQNNLRLCSTVLILCLVLMLSAGNVAASAAAVWPTNAAAANSAGRWPALAEIQCAAYVVVERGNGNVLLEKQADLPLYPASTTKVLTALLALEKLDLNAVVTVSAEAIKLPAGSSKVGYRAGEQVVVKDMLAGMMLASGNDAANAFAEAISGTQEQFAFLMNERARQAGAVHSNFMNPSGTHHELHVTTARDLSLITIAAMKNPRFRELVALESCSLPATNLHPFNGWSVLINTNRLMVFDESYYKSDWIKSVTGVKTGSTNMAGDCLIASATTTAGAELVSVLLKAPLSTADSNKAVSMRTLLEEGAKKLGGNVSPSPSSTSGTSAAPSSTAPTAGVTTVTGKTASSMTSASPSSTSTAGSTSQPGATTLMTDKKPVNAGMLEELRMRFGIDQPTFMLVGLVLGILLGLLVGLIFVITVYQATHKRKTVSGRPAKRR